MSVNLDIPWKRYGLIAELAHRLRDVSPQFGKTALQKMVYLLQEVFEIDCGYDFQLYSYGPFDSQLLQDLDLVEHVGAVTINPVLSMTGGYEILPGEKADILREKAIDFLGNEKVSAAVDKLVREFGHFWAKDLELRSTIVYVVKDLKRNKEKVTKEKLKKVIKNVKPRFSSTEIEKAINELLEKGFIKAD